MKDNNVLKEHKEEGRHQEMMTGIMALMLRSEE